MLLIAQDATTANAVVSVISSLGFPIFAQKNGYQNATYTGTSAQNLDLINKAKEGILKK